MFKWWPDVAPLWLSSPYIGMSQMVEEWMIPMDEWKMLFWHDAEYCNGCQHHSMG